MDKNNSYKEYYKILFTALFTSLTTAFFTVYLFGERLETVKTKLAIEQKLVEKRIQVTEDVIEKASSLYQLALLYRSIDIHPELDMLPQIYKDMASSLDKDQFANNNSILTSQKDFQVALFSSNPFIEGKTYESLSKFGVFINMFINTKTNGPDLRQLQKQAGKELLNSMNMFRRLNNLDLLPEYNGSNS
jgi:hypothetical protein